MNEVYARRAAPDAWQRPRSLVSRRVDRFTGFLATNFCPPQEVYQEWYIPGTEPIEECPYHPDPFRFGVTSSAADAPPGGWGAQSHNSNGGEGR